MVETIAFIHGRLAQTTILFAFILGAWAGWKFLRKQSVDSSYWGALVIGEILVVGQGVLGLIMVLLGTIPADLIHFLYGVLVALGWPAVYLYTNGRANRAEMGFYALMSFFIFGLAIRAITTGG